MGGCLQGVFSCVEGGVVSLAAEACANRLLHFFSMLTGPGPADVAKLQMEPAWEDTTLGPHGILGDVVQGVFSHVNVRAYERYYSITSRVPMDCFTSTSS